MFISRLAKKMISSSPRTFCWNDRQEKRGFLMARLTVWEARHMAQVFYIDDDENADWLHGTKSKRRTTMTEGKKTRSTREVAAKLKIDPKQLRAVLRSLGK